MKSTLLIELESTLAFSLHPRLSLSDLHLHDPDQYLGTSRRLEDLVHFYLYDYLHVAGLTCSALDRTSHHWRRA